MHHGTVSTTFVTHLFWGLETHVTPIACKVMNGFHRDGLEVLNRVGQLVRNGRETHNNREKHKSPYENSRLFPLGVTGQLYRKLPVQIKSKVK